MGNVYLAEDARIEQQVAVKVIRAEGTLYPNALTDQDGLRLFRREAKAIARLDHPNILPLFDYGEERLGDTMVIYLVMLSPLTALNQCLSQQIDEVLLHALAKSPEQRFASITAFASAIH